ncbi:MAG: ABC transporter ATP-binding protein [bacterium]
MTLAVPDGAWGIVLGPAGAGKTTLLEAIAGVRRVTSGRVVLRGVDVTTVPAERRGAALVHQHAFLFPHLTVAENIRYGARDAAFAREVSRRLGADVLEHQPVSSLSGGERQVVALARALAAEPSILLLDEPFAALDPRRRARTRSELRSFQQQRGITVLHVTHDFEEAGTVGDVAIVLDAGRVVQVASPAALFRHPANGAVADFLGAENLFVGTIERLGDGADGVAPLRFTGEGLVLFAVGDHAGGAGHAVIRGDEIVISHGGEGSSSMRNAFHGIVREIAPAGPLARVSVDVGPTPLVAIVTGESSRALDLKVGDDVVLSCKATTVHLC